MMQHHQRCEQLGKPGEVLQHVDAEDEDEALDRPVRPERIRQQ